MAFKEMIDDFKKKGILDEDGKLTNKGHDYAEQIKKDYNNNIKPFHFEQPEVETFKKTKKSIVWNIPF
jgi:hypothetical protein